MEGDLFIHTCKRASLLPQLLQPFQPAHPAQCNGLLASETARSELRAGLLQRRPECRDQSGGRLRINPTCPTAALAADGSTTPRIVGSRVANFWRFEYCAWVNALKNVDFPAWCTPPDNRGHRTDSRAASAARGCGAHFQLLLPVTKPAVIFRRSVSSWFPGPLVPSRLPIETSPLHALQTGKRYSSCAIQRNWPSRVRACVAKMSRMSWCDRAPSVHNLSCCVAGKRQIVTNNKGRRDGAAARRSLPVFLANQVAGSGGRDGAEIRGNLRAALVARARSSSKDLQR